MGGTIAGTFAFGLEDIEGADDLWAILVFTILCSVVVHRVTATSVMERLDRRRARRLAPDEKSCAQRCSATGLHLVVRLPTDNA